MGDDSKKRPADDRTVEVGGDALSKLRAAAERRAQQARAPEPEHQTTSPQLRSLRPSQPGLGGGQDIREMLEEARKAGSAGEPEGEGATKAIKRDNLVELLKGEVKEANAADDAPSVGILRHTRPKGETPQQLLAQGRSRSATPQVIDSSHQRIGERPTRTSDLEALSRALEELEDDKESTRQVTVIPELRASAPRREALADDASSAVETAVGPTHLRNYVQGTGDATLAADDASSRALRAMLRDLPRDGEATVAADEASSRAIKALAQQSFDEDSNATREVGSMRELLRQAQSSGAFVGLERSTAASQRDDSQDYSLEEFMPEGGGLEEESAGSMHVGIKVASADAAQAPDAAAPPVKPLGAAALGGPLATPAPMPVVTPAPQPAIPPRRTEPTPAPAAPNREIKQTPPPSIAPAEPAALAPVEEAAKSPAKFVLALVLALLVLIAVVVLATQGG